MAAKKKSPSRAKTPEGPQPEPQQPTKAGAPSNEGAMPPEELVPEERKSDQPGPPVAGIGASAGGLDAFKKFFTAMPPDSGIAFVLIPHLDPKHESLMAELLTRYTKMPVVEATAGTRCEANHVYILPPNKYMTIVDGVLQLSGPVAGSGPPTSIDVFLRSLANDQLERAICIILSGTGAHGTPGLKAVKAAGGLAMVQDPETADYDVMPRNAVATGLADYVLPVEQMPQALIQYVQQYYAARSKADTDEAAASSQPLNEVLALLRIRSKLDFRYYRKKMLTRRVERRMSLSHCNEWPAYLAYLREHPDEIKQLTRDLLISVTSFFRDPEAWHALETHVLAPLVATKEGDDTLRIWSAGCATGEEAYTVGMLALEQVAAQQKSCPIHVFATDIDEAALDVGRHAAYSDSIAADVSPARLARFFMRVNDSTYQVSKQLREAVTFARQNLIADPPFSKLDLIVCRNLLIYLEAEVQRKVVSLLHFALRDGGYLFLGPSETIGRHTDLFEPISKKWRLYRRIGPPRPERVEFPITAARDPFKPPMRPAAGAPVRPVHFGELTQRLLLHKFAPAAVLVNRKYEILYIFGPADRYLSVYPGVPTPDLMLMAREGLGSKLRAAIHTALRQNGPVTLGDVEVKRNGNSYAVLVGINPLQEPPEAEGLLLITFQDAGQAVAPPRPPEPVSEESMVRQLENELKATKEDLQTTIEELESSNEELKASNEEVMSMNEELQSANEEMETSKEELQSLNEELSTVNNQLQDKVQDLETTTNDLTNFLNCTDFATIFLDLDLCIRRFTPATTSLLKVIASDVGRPLGDLVKTFADDNLLADTQQLLKDLAPREKEVRSEAGRWYVRRLLPYRTLDNRIAGVVLSFVDITERKQAADAVVWRLAALVENSADAIISKDLDGTIRAWNRGAERLYGYTPDEVIGKPIALLVPNERIDELAKIMSRLQAGEHTVQMETERIRKDGTRVAVSVTVSPVLDGNGKVVSGSAIERDITKRK
jgi:two-component system CheB/CheR fusion protein